MPIKEQKVNGKIPVNSVQYVVNLAELRANSLYICLLKIKHHIKKEEYLKTEEAKNEYDTSTLLDLYQYNGNLIRVYCDVYNKDGQDLYEFFYQETGFDEKGYYACQFPIDWLEFKKKRVAEKLFKKALKDEDGKELVTYMEENFKIFIRCLKVKVTWRENF